MPSLSLVRTVEEGIPDAGNTEPRHRGASLVLIQEGQPSQHYQSEMGSSGVWSWTLKSQGPIVSE